MEEDDSDSPFWKRIFLAGCLALGVVGLLAFAGWPGSGLILVPIGLGLIIVCVSHGPGRISQMPAMPSTAPKTSSELPVVLAAP